MNRNILPGQTYKHFKGHIVKILCIAKDSETLESVVVYHHIDNDEYWVRPLEMFNSLVDKVKYPDVTQVYRFEKIESNNE